MSAFCFVPIRKQLFFICGSLALAGIAEPNKSVKGTRRPLAVLKFCFYQGWRLRLSPVSGAPLTVTLGIQG